MGKHLTRQQQKAMFAKRGNPDRQRIDNVAIFQSKGRITGGEVDVRKGRQLVGKRLVVVTRTQGGVILKLRKK